MKPRTIVTTALLIFVCATAAYFVLGEVRARSAARRSETTPGAIAPTTAGTDAATAPSPETAGSSKASGDASVRPTPSGTERTGRAVHDEARLAADASAARSSGAGTRRDVSPADSQSVNSQLSDSPAPTAAPAQKVLAYYFHGTQRCPTCMKLEAYSAEAIEKGFGDALKQGRLEWRVVNVDEPANKHFVDDYQLYTKALVIVKTQGGKRVEWKNLEKIWELVGDKDDFIKYVQGEVSAYVGAAR